MHLQINRFFALALAALLALAAFSATPQSALAQDNKLAEQYGVEVTQPEGWEKSSGNEKAVAVFTEPKTQSQFEVVPTKLMTADVSEVFFNTFHKTLTESTFERVGEPSTKELFGDKNAKETIYKFNHSGVTLKVHVVSFLRGTTAWLVVGYMEEKEEGNIKPLFDSMITNLKFSDKGE